MDRPSCGECRFYEPNAARDGHGFCLRYPPSGDELETGHVGRELWGRRQLAGWCKTAANKLLARRLERRAAKRAAEAAAKDLTEGD